MSTPAKLDSVSSRTGSDSPRNGSVLPAERAEANSRSCVERKASLLQAADQLDADGAGGADDGDDGGGTKERAGMRVISGQQNKKAPSG